MSARMALLRQPGPREPVRLEVCHATFRAHRYRHMASAPSLLEALAAQVDDSVDAAVLWLGGAELEHADHLIPAISRDPTRAVTFSAERRDTGPIELLQAHATLGRRDGQRFVHCHGLWRLPDGRLRAGHLLPDRNAPRGSPVGVVHVLDGVSIRSAADAETGFPLLQPLSIEEHPMTQTSDTNGIFVRIRPNEDLVETVERLCVSERLDHAVVRASLGSLIGATLERLDGTVEHIAGPVVEVVSMIGVVRPDADGTPRADISGVVVDTDGKLFAGRFSPGRNTVAVTFELAVESWHQ